MHRQCRLCNARCCRYFCLPIDNPCTYDEFEQVRWYLVHGGVSVHVDHDGGWWMLVENRCRWLEDSAQGPRCVAYDNRPLICRRFSPRTCDFTRGPFAYEHRFETADELEDYARDVLGAAEFAAARRAMTAVRRPRKAKRPKPKRPRQPRSVGGRVLDPNRSV